MSTEAVICPFEDCKHFGKVEYVELKRFRYHLARDHDRVDLVQFAFEKGIIQDPTKYHNHSYIIKKIAELSKVNGDLCHGSS